MVSKGMTKNETHWLMGVVLGFVLATVYYMVLC